MNEIEARGKIKYRIANEMRKYGENKEEYEDLEIALQVMKEIREYRELGTVEYIQLTFSLCKGLEAMVKMYEAIGTVEEFKALRNASELWEHNNNLAYTQGRIDAIDEFVKEIEAEYDNDGCPNVSDYLDYKISIRDLQKIAEHLKGGAE